MASKLDGADKGGSRIMRTKPPVSLSIHDARVQAVVWQVIVLATVAALAYYLWSNTVHNLSTKSIKTGFDFLTREAGFEIGETLIAYSPASSFGRALLVGFLNTLHVSIIGIVLATLLGLLIGVGSLSKNWLVAKLTAGYIHFMRNIPVLLHIVLWYTLLISDRFLPGPRAAQPILGMYATQRGIYLPVPEAHAGWSLALLGLAVAVIAAGFLFRREQAIRNATGTAPSIRWHVAGLIVALPLAGWLIGGAPTGMSWPTLRGFNLAGGARITPEFMAILLGLGIYTSAFIGEIVRAGIMAVPKGQTEAARALGLKEGVILSRVILPQALRVIVPPLTSQYLNLTKNSSLSVAIGYPDLVNSVNTTITQTGQAIEGIVILMVVFLTTSLVTSAFMNWYNARIALKER